MVAWHSGVVGRSSAAPEQQDHDGNGVTDVPGRGGIPRGSRLSSGVGRLLLLIAVLALGAGILAMHSVGTGHHSAHGVTAGGWVSQPPDAVAGAPTAHSHLPDSAVAEATALAERVTLACGGSCNLGEAGAVCLAVVGGIALLLLNRHAPRASQRSPAPAGGPPSVHHRRPPSVPAPDLLVLLCVSRT